MTLHIPHLFTDDCLVGWTHCLEVKPDFCYQSQTYNPKVCPLYLCHRKVPGNYTPHLFVRSLPEEWSLLSCPHILTSSCSLDFQKPFHNERPVEGLGKGNG